jgi:hypothetical protein
MNRLPRSTTFAAIAMFGVACSDPATSALNNAATAVSAAFSTAPLGYADLTSSYSGTDGDAGSLWLPGPRSIAFGMGGGAMMGGGLGDAFVGGIAGGPGGGHRGPFAGGLACTGTFSAATGRVTCDSVTRDGLSITQSAQYRTAANVIQQAFDTATTNSVNVQTSVAGTRTYARDSANADRRHGPRHAGRIAGDTTTILTASSTVRHASDRTVTGLASGSTQRTVNGTSSGQESSTGTSSRGAFTSTRSAADTTRGVIVPIANGRPTYPTAGTVIRVMQASVTYTGQAATTTSRREVVTYDGSTTAKVTITQDGTTKNCTLPLPRGRLTCE